MTQNNCFNQSRVILNKSLPVDEEDLLNYNKNCNLPINTKHRFSMIPNVRNMIDPSQYCRLITRKCDTNKYYIHKYDPNFWMQIIEQKMKLVKLAD